MAEGHATLPDVSSGLETPTNRYLQDHLKSRILSTHQVQNNFLNILKNLNHLVI